MGPVPRALAAAVLAAVAFSGCQSNPPSTPDLEVAADLLIDSRQDWAGWVQVAGPRTVVLGPGAELHVTQARVAAADGLHVLVGSGARLAVTASTLDGVAIEVQEGGAATLQETIVLQTQGAIAVRGGRLDLEGGHLQGSPESAVSVAGGAARLRGVTVAGSGGRLPAIDGKAGDLEVSGSVIEGADAYGIRWAGGNVTVTGTLVGTTADYGLLAQNATVALRGNEWHPRCGVFLVGVASATLEDERFLSEHRAVTAHQAASVRVAASRFAAASEVLTATESHLELEGSEFAGGHVRLNATRAAWEGSAMGPTTMEAAGASEVRLRGNGWDATASLVVRASAGAQVDAVGNWWGTADGPAAGNLVGPVAATPWLSEWSFPYSAD